MSYWASSRLAEVALINPKLPFCELDDNMEVSFLPMKLVEEEINKIHLTEYRKYSSVKRGFTPMIDGDVIFAKITPCMENGKIAIVHSLKNHIGFGSTEFHVLRPFSCVFNRYLFYYLVQKSIRDSAAANMSGAVGQRRVPRIYLENLIIPIPPLPEQHRIVAKIEQLFSSLDKGIQSLKTAQQQLKVYRQSVLKFAFEGRFTNPMLEDNALPIGWSKQPLSSLGDIVAGGTPSTEKPEYWNGEISWITPADLSGYNKKYISKGRKSITRAGLNSSSAKLIPGGSVLFSSRAPIGYVAIAKNELCTNQGFKSIIPSNIIESEYLYYFLLSAKQMAEEAANGTTFKEISKANFSKLLVPLPSSLAEQHQIVSEIESRLSVCDKIEETIEQSLKQAEALRQSILKKAFEGKLLSQKELEECRQDPSWQPASVLLEKIRSEKSSTVKPPVINKPKKGSK